MNTTSFHANGKLLLSGEYFVLDGALAIGLPCRFGQSLTVTTDFNTTNTLQWKSISDLNEVWFEASYLKDNLSLLESSDHPTATVLQNILLQARALRTDFIKSNHSTQVETKLSFPRDWGLGSSSTLIYSLAQWANVDPFELSSRTLGGSGYDIACAGVTQPIRYQLINKKVQFDPIQFNPSFKDQLFFIHLGKKQNSRSGIKRYREKGKINQIRIDKISQISGALLQANSLKDFQNLLLQHEKLVQETIELERIQDVLFPDFDGVIKSLGAWGGDFVLAASNQDITSTQNYFNKKGFKTFFKYVEMVR